VNTLLTLVVLVVLVVLIYLILSNPHRQTRKIHRDAEQAVRSSSEKYYENARRTLER
jgi:uncharacterized membrane protein